MTADHPLPTELLALDRRFTLVEEPVEMPLGRLTLCKPRNADDLISEADFVKDERLPYWADLWSASIILGSFIETTLGGACGAEPRVAPSGVGRRALELGCGLGLVTIAALRAGYDVTATDYYEDATRFAARNALTNTGRAPSTRMVDWRALPGDLGRYDLVLAADVLYEPPHAALVAEVMRRTLAPGGTVLVADQGRVALSAFLEESAARGLVHKVVHRETRPTVPASPVGSAVHAITIFELRHG